jgi:KAP-like P-loop domain-containing protein
MLLHYEEAVNMTADLDWLRTQKPPRGSPAFGNKRVNLLVKLVLECPTPYSIGLFGTWGSGKTAVLASALPQLESAGMRPIYFNAWKYAHYADITNTLVYRLIMEVKEEKKGIGKGRSKVASGAEVDRRRIRTRAE